MYLRNFLTAALALLVAVTTALVLLVAILVPVYFLEKSKCYDRWPKESTEYSLFTGCMVEYEGKVVPADNVRFIVED